MAIGPFGGDVFNVVRSWMTEANPANWPEGACVDILNMEIGPQGEVYRRLGLVEELGGTDLAPLADIVGQAVSVHLWKDAGGTPGNDIILIQRGLSVSAYGNSAPLSSYYIGTVTLPIDTHPAEASTRLMSITSINGDAIITHPNTKPHTLGLPHPQELELYPIMVEIRVQESISHAPVNSRPTSLTHEFEFDLRNAGWPYSALCTKDEKGTGSVRSDPVQYTHDKLGIWPALSDAFYACKTSAAEEAVALDTYSPWELQKNDLSTGFSLNGRFITEAFKLDTGLLMSRSYAPVPLDPHFQDIVDAIENVFGDVGGGGFGQAGGPITTRTVTRTTTRRPSAVATLNGRIVYAGRDYNDVYCLFFSQLAVDRTNYGRCYQDADPTVEEVNDLVATDGGVIRAPGLGTVSRMVELNTQLIIFSTTGVWALDGGGAGEAFSADAFRISRLSPEGCLSPQSVVEIGSNLMFFGKTGIHTVSVDQVGTTVVQNLSLTTIQTFYDNLPLNARITAVGAADASLGRVEWTMTLHDDSEYYTLVLVFDARQGGWRKHRVPYGDERVLLPLPPYSATASGAGTVIEEQITTTTGEVVTTTMLDPLEYLVSQLVTDVGVARRFRYLIGTHLSNKMRVGDMSSTQFQDFYGTAVAPRDAAGYIDFPYMYNTLPNGGGTKRSARASAQYINAYTLRGRLL